MLTETGEIEPFDSLGDDGSETYGTKITDVAMRVDEERQIVTGDIGSGDDELTPVLLEQEVNVSDRIHLPDGTVMEVQKAGEMPSTDGRVSLYWAEG